MSGLTVEQIIKWGLAILVVVIIILGVYLFFKNHILEFFKNFGGILGLLK